MNVPSENTAKLDIPTSTPTAFSDLGRFFLGTSSTMNDTYHFLVEDLRMVNLLITPSTGLCNQTLTCLDYVEAAIDVIVASPILESQRLFPSSLNPVSK